MAAIASQNLPIASAVRVRRTRFLLHSWRWRRLGQGPIPPCVGAAERTVFLVGRAGSGASVATGLSDTCGVEFESGDFGVGLLPVPRPELTVAEALSLGISGRVNSHWRVLARGGTGVDEAVE